MRQLLLDEATNFSFDISKKLTALRGAGVRVQLIAQEYAEMLRVFGEHAGPTIFNQSSLKSFFGVTDLELAKRLSARLGDRYVSRQSFNLGKTPWDELSESASVHKVPLMSPARIMNMPADEQLVLIEGLRPIHCHKLPYDCVSPWLAWLNDNPVEGGKLPGPARIRLDYTSRGVFVRGAGKQALRRRKRRVGLPLWLLFAGFWIGLVLLGARAMGWG